MESAGGWPQGWLDTGEETMKVRLSAAIRVLV